jgi:cytoskeletal protein RodZ
VPATAPDNSTAAEIGACLRDARESRGISLDEAAQVTRVGKNYLFAIEAGAFDKLPNPAYGKGFIRIYAKYLGLSADEILSRYEQGLSAPTVKPEEPYRQERPGSVATSGEGTKGRWLVPAILLATTLIIASLMNGKDHREEGKKLSPSPQPALVPTPLQPSRTSATLPQVASPAGAETATPPPASPAGEPQGEGIILRLKVNQDSWLNITIDDTVSQAYDLKTGDLIEWKAARNFALDLSNAGGIEAEFNGKPLKPFGEPGKSAHVVLKAQGE